MPKRKLVKKPNIMYINEKTDKYMGHSPIEKPIKKVKSSPCSLSSKIIPPLLTASTSHICSHQ